MGSRTGILLPLNQVCNWNIMWMHTPRPRKPTHESRHPASTNSWKYMACQAYICKHTFSRVSWASIWSCLAQLRQERILVNFQGQRIKQCKRQLQTSSFGNSQAPAEDSSQPKWGYPNGVHGEEPSGKDQK